MQQNQDYLTVYYGGANINLGFSFSWYLSILPSQKVDMGWLKDRYQKAKLTSGKIGNTKATPDALTLWLPISEKEFIIALNEFKSYLISQGWEKHDEHQIAELAGEINYRHIISPKTSQHQQHTLASSSNPPSPIELLKYLTALRDARILSQEEFETKAAEVTKRM